MHYEPGRQIGRTAAEDIAVKIGFERTDHDFENLVARLRADQSADEIKAFITARKIEDVFRLKP